MNADTMTGPDVAEFVAAVRARLTDLPAEAQQDLTEGLEADLADKVAEQGSAVLGDPDTYASELRVAAGFSGEPAPVRERRSLGEWATADLDGLHRRWDALVSDLPGDPWDFLQAMRPAWWVARAWLALQLADLVLGGGSINYGLSPLPSLGSFSWPLLIAAVVVSVQIGRGKLWPGRPRSGPGGRLLLVLLNGLAIAITPVVLTSLFTPAKADSSYGVSADGDDYMMGYRDGESMYQREGIYASGKWISQIYPYDAAGKPLVGVQLFDQEGQPLNLITQTECVYDEGGQLLDQGRVYYPWTKGSTQLQNVVPVPSVIPAAGLPDPDPLAFQRKQRPSVGQFPLVSVPPVSLPGLKVSKGVTPPGAVQPGARPQTPINGIDEGC